MKQKTIQRYDSAGQLITEEHNDKRIGKHRNERHKTKKSRHRDERHKKERSRYL